MKVTVINYNSGNVLSVLNALRRIGVEAQLSDDIECIRNSDRIIFPGQGEARQTMDFMRKHSLDQAIKELTQPYLGICIGMQILAERSEEKDTLGLNLLQGEKVSKFSTTGGGLKIPHMGWNTVSHLRSPLFKHIPEDAYFYYVHSYYMPLNAYTIAETDYIHPFSAAVQKGNFYATQFHPEKSGTHGLQLLRNFIEL